VAPPPSAAFMAGGGAGPTPFQPGMARRSASSAARGRLRFSARVFERSARVDFQKVLQSAPGTPIVRTLAHHPNDETVVLRAVINGELLAREIADPRHASRIAER